MAQKVILAAICHRTDDKSHKTIVGQQTIAAMVGMSVRSVHRSVGILGELGVITRRKRRGNGGYRTSDEITVNRAYTTESHVTDDQVTEGHVTDSPTSRDTQSDLTGHSVMAEEINQIDQPEGQPDNALVIAGLEQVTFDEFYAIWPKKRKRPDAQKAWDAAVKRAAPETILAAARAYVDNPHRQPVQFVPYPATWLRADGWGDDLDGPPETQRNTMTRGEKNLAYVQQLAAQQAAQTRGIAS